MGIAETSWLKQTHPIVPRRPRFDLGATPLHWLADDPLTTHMLNIMQILAPTEKWFCQTFREAQPYIRDERLAEAVSAFIKQEGAHNLAHAEVARRISALGIDAERYARQVEWLFVDMLGTAPLGRKLRNPRARLAWLKARLAMIAAFEHLTTVLGNWILNTSAFDEAPADPVILELYRWHGAEEVEHCEVADALFRHLSGSYALRVAGAAFIFPLLAGLAGNGAVRLVADDPALPHRLRWRDYRRAARQGRIFGPGVMIRACLRYLGPGHSPLDECSAEQALHYLSNFERGNKKQHP